MRDRESVGALAAAPEDLESIASTHMVARDCDFRSWGPGSVHAGDRHLSSPANTQHSRPMPYTNAAALIFDTSLKLPV